MDRERENTPRQSEPREPAEVIRDGNLKASIWRNEGEKGAFYATTFARTYRDDEGQYRDSGSFIASDLLKLSELARSAYTRTNALRREERMQARDKDGDSRAQFQAKRSKDKEPARSSDYER